MEFAKPNSIIIKVMGYYVPEKVVTNDDIAQIVDTSDAWIYERSGIRRRHVSEGESASDMAVKSARAALEEANLSASDIDLVIVTTVTPDMMFPSTACLVQAKLGIRNNIPCFDLEAACTGFVYGMEVATSMMQSGKYTITLLQPEHGSISAEKTEAADGETVTLSYREDSNYDFAGWSVTTDDGTAVSVSGNSFTMPAANVTVTAQFHYDPPYIPTYYDIYFDGDENDSVRYDCSNTSIREGGTFAFYAEPATGYDPETLIIEYKRGRAGSWKTVEPNSRGQYRITNVHADIYVRSRVEPIEAPTALDKVGDGKSTICSDGRRIRISTTEPQTMHIINVGGRLIRTAQLPAGDTEVNDLPQGFYIVLLSDGTRAKTLIN